MTNIKDELGYVAGPYRATSEWEVTCNIRNAEKIAVELWRMGYPCICPHKNTSYFGGVLEDDQAWLDGDFVILKRCDFVVLVSGWQVSKGTLAEIEVAKEYEIPVFYTLNEFNNFYIRKE